MNLSFEPISLDKQKDYAELLDNCPQVASDYSFLNLWAWAEDYGLHWAWEENLVWIKQTRPEVFFWAPIGPWKLIDWQARYDGHADSRMDFIRVPQKLAELWSAAVGDEATVVEERGHWDYLYTVAEADAGKTLADHFMYLISAGMRIEVAKLFQDDLTLLRHPQV